MVRKTLEEHNNADTNKPKDINVKGYKEFCALIKKIEEESKKNSIAFMQGNTQSQGSKVEKYNQVSTGIDVLKKALKLQNSRLFQVSEKYEENSDQIARAFRNLMLNNSALKNIEKIAQTKNLTQFKEEKEKVEKKFKELIQNPKMQKVIKSGEFIQVVRTLGEVASETIANLTMPEQEIKSLAKAVVDKMRKVMAEKHPKVTNLPNALPPPVSQSSAKRPGSERGGR